MPHPKANKTPTYAVPALEKGLDILELLASHPDGLSQADIGQRLNRSHTEIFRMLNCLLERDYVVREGARAEYGLSRKLFEIAHTHRKTESLADAALPRMKQLAMTYGHNCHLSVEQGGRALNILEAQSDQDWRFSIRLGATVPLDRSASGRILLAFKHLDAGDDVIRSLCSDSPPKKLAPLLRQLREIRRRGYEKVSGETFDGIVDISVPVFDEAGGLCAALTMPVLLSMSRKIPLDTLLNALRKTAIEISKTMGYFSPTEE